MAKLLLLKEADIEDKDNNGRALLYWTHSEGYDDVVECKRRQVAA